MPTVAQTGTRKTIISRESWRFFVRYGGYCQAHGLGRDDVTQQAWAEWCHLEAQWPTNPGKYLGLRLLDWVRGFTAYDHHTKFRPAFVGLDATTGVAHLDDTFKSAFIREVVEVAGNVANGLGCRHADALRLWLEGYRMREVGEKLGLTEGRISQMLKAVFAGTKRRIEG